MEMEERAFKLMAAAPVEGCLVEFGVYKGDSLIKIAQLARKYLPQMSPQSYGFDSFEGMPSTGAPLEGIHAQDWAEGTFAARLESVQKRLQNEGVVVRLVKGVFEDLLPLTECGISKVRFAYIDADIYEGYRDALRLLTPHVQVGTVLLFDESMPPTDHLQQCIRTHGKRAVEEWENEAGLNLHLIRFERTRALHVIVDEEYLKQYAHVITRLRRDTVWESIKNIIKTLLGR